MKTGKKTDRPSSKFKTVFQKIPQRKQRHPREREKTFANHTYDKEFVSIIYRTLITT